MTNSLHSLPFKFEGSPSDASPREPTPREPTPRDAAHRDGSIAGSLSRAEVAARSFVAKPLEGSRRELGAAIAALSHVKSKQMSPDQVQLFWQARDLLGREMPSSAELRFLTRSELAGSILRRAASISQ